MSWFNNLGEKTGRTDIWVILITFLFIAATYFHFVCGIGAVELCDQEFLSYNQYIISTILIGFFVDLGIKTWKK